MAHNQPVRDSDNVVGSGTTGQAGNGNGGTRKFGSYGQAGAYGSAGQCVETNIIQ